MSERSTSELSPARHANNDANNYRGITLISCLQKIFTSVINNRLLKWSNENSIVTDAQFGFIPG